MRELRNIIERLVIMTPGDRIEMRDLPAAALAGRLAGPREHRAARAGPAEFPSLADARDDFEKRYIWKKYQESGGNMSRTAELLQVERSNLYRKMKGFGLIPARKGRAPGARPEPAGPAGSPQSPAGRPYSVSKKRGISRQVCSSLEYTRQRSYGRE